MSITFIDASDGARIAVDVQGEGPLVVFVHGFPEGPASWDAQVAALSGAGYRTANIHNRGYGLSDKPSEIEPYAMHRLSQDVVEVVAALSDEPVVLVGHDWGAVQVQTAALIAPEKARGVCTLAVATLAYADLNFLDFWKTTYPDGFFYQSYFAQPDIPERELSERLDEFVRAFFFSLSGDRPGDSSLLIQPPGTTDLLASTTVPTPFPSWLSEREIADYVEAFASGGLTGPINRYRAQVFDADGLRPYAERMIEAPTIFIGGDRDPSRELAPGMDTYPSPLDRARDPRGSYLLPGIGHWVQQEAPHTVNGILLDFLAKLSPVSK